MTEHSPQCKTTALPLKGYGRRWDGDHGKVMMAVACLADSGVWSRHWTTLDAERN